MSQETAENDKSVLGDVVDLHETAMSTDRDSPRPEEDHPSTSMNPHPKKFLAWSRGQRSLDYGL